LDHSRKVVDQLSVEDQRSESDVPYETEEYFLNTFHRVLKACAQQFKLSQQAVRRHFEEAQNARGTRRYFPQIFIGFSSDSLSRFALLNLPTSFA
jgi:hypothetical protein